MITWWQVYITGKPVFGFSTKEVNGIVFIESHNDWRWRGIPVKEYKPYLLNDKAKVVKITEILSF